MKKLYTFTSLFILLLLLAGCSKDFLKAYEKRIIGTWKITDINRFGIGSSDNLPFPENGVFVFSQDGELAYTYAGSNYKGTWDIRKEYRDDDKIRSLHITAIDFTNQDVRSEFFNEVVFTGTDHFKAFIYSGTKTYSYHFVRQ
jgi:hypothetical protein